MVGAIANSLTTFHARSSLSLALVPKFRSPNEVHGNKILVVILALLVKRSVASVFRVARLVIRNTAPRFVQQRQLHSSLSNTDYSFNFF